MAQQENGGLGPIIMLASAVLPFWFRVNPWRGMSEVDFFLFCAGCAVTFFFGYMRWFMGAWRPLFVMITALLIRASLVPICIFVIWFLFLRTPGCWEIQCSPGEPEPVEVIKARHCKAHPEDSRCP